MKLYLVLSTVLCVLAWAKPLHQAGSEEIQQEYGIERRAPIAQTKPPEKPDPCDKCDMVYFSCLDNSDYCRQHTFSECLLHCRIEACDYQDCYRNCGWTECTHENVLQADAQLDGAKQGETQQESTVEERNPVTQHPDKPQKNPCEKCDKKFESCMNDWWCWFHKDECLTDCRIEVCQDIEECNQKCGYNDCEVRKQTVAFQENHRKATSQEASNGETTEKQQIGEITGTQQEPDADPDNRNPAVRAASNLDSTDVSAHLDHAVESNADCNSCKGYYNRCLDLCGAWWSPDARPEKCYAYCEVETCKFQDCKKTCLTWSSSC